MKHWLEGRLKSIRKHAGLAISTLAATVAIAGCGKGTVWSTKDEVRIGREASKEVDRMYRVEVDSEDARRGQRVGNRLLLHTDSRVGVPYTFRGIDAKDVNPVSLPGGPAYVFRGLLDLAGDDDDRLACGVGPQDAPFKGRAHSAPRH